jgi:undecaprenyl diphosphate synthase
MLQSKVASPAMKSLHVAIIMDGNGRWATRRGLPRTAGHHEGVGAVRRIVQAAPDLGIAALTLFAFSSDNWRRPADEVDALMALLRKYLRAETKRLVEGGARLTVIGRRDRLPPWLFQDIAEAEARTADGRRLDLRIAFDYSSRDAIMRAAARWPADQPPSPDQFGKLVAQAVGEALGPAEVDLLVRTGGEKRLSDFLLWECAYAELWFTDKAWPDFAPTDLAEAIGEFRRRERRFGGLGNGQPMVALAGGQGR